MRRTSLALAVVGATVGGGTLAAPASAKTFTARITDPSGDAPAGTPDIVAARVAYNRRTGALSYSVTMADTIDVKATPAMVIVHISGLSHGRCTTEGGFTAVMALLPGMGGTTKGKDASDGAPAMLGVGAFHGNDGQAYAGARGTQTIAGDTVTMRARNRKFGGFHPGCAVAAIFTSFDQGEDGTQDTTAGNTGFTTSKR